MDARQVSFTMRQVKLGVIEFHSDRLNPGLRQKFFEVVGELQDSGSIVDVWLMDIAALLDSFGYEMKIYARRKPAPSSVGDV